MSEQKLAVLAIPSRLVSSVVDPPAIKIPVQLTGKTVVVNGANLIQIQILAADYWVNARYVFVDNKPIEFVLNNTIDDLKTLTIIDAPREQVSQDNENAVPIYVHQELWTRIREWATGPWPKCCDKPSIKHDNSHGGTDGIRVETPGRQLAMGGSGYKIPVLRVVCSNCKAKISVAIDPQRTYNRVIVRTASGDFIHDDTEWINEAVEAISTLNENDALAQMQSELYLKVLSMISRHQLTNPSKAAQKALQTLINTPRKQS